MNNKKLIVKNRVLNLKTQISASNFEVDGVSDTSSVVRSPSTSIKLQFPNFITVLISCFGLRNIVHNPDAIRFLGVL